MAHNQTHGDSDHSGGANVKQGQIFQAFARTTEWYASWASVSSGSAFYSNNELQVTPLMIPRAVTLDRIGISVVTAGETSCTVRLGVYADDGTGYPGALSFDAGTVAADTTGDKAITISQALSAGLYWLAGCAQGMATTKAALRSGTATAGAAIPVGATSADQTTNFGSCCPPGYNQTGVTGGLPANFTTTPSNPSAGCYRVMVRIT